MPPSLPSPGADSQPSPSPAPDTADTPKAPEAPDDAPHGTEVPSVAEVPGVTTVAAPGGLFASLFDSATLGRELDDAAWLRAMLDAERALSRAASRAGLVSAEAADAVAEACAAYHRDPAALGRRGAEALTPVLPLVRDLVEAVPSPANVAVHPGAASQDIIDTAAALVAHRALGVILDDLAGSAASCARLADTHRTSVMAGRAMLQHAMPTTFGLVCAGWLTGLNEARTRLDQVRRERLAVQLGGAVGTLGTLGGHGVAVLAHYAAELGLAEPALPWHTNRTRVGELAGALAGAAGVLAGIAADVALLAQTEIGEVSEGSRAGDSSTTSQRHNPMHAVAIAANAQQAPGLAATLFATMAQEHQRAAGAWQAEWPTVTALLRVVGGAAWHARALLAGLRVNPAALRANLARSDGLPLAPSVAERLAPALGRTTAHALVAKAVEQVSADGVDLRAALWSHPALRAHLSEAELDATMDPLAALGSADAFIDRALELHRHIPR